MVVFQAGPPAYSQVSIQEYAGRLAVLVPSLSQAHSWLDISPVSPSSCQEILGPSCAVFTGLVLSVKSVAQPCLDSLEVVCEEQ